ncbi:hypothetical protein [Nocardioides sp.]|uniref:hypothetical protein n=1 Tax=Nocardioides sp. TaxID=35761 RepID=UPI00260D61E8|nr:hypothetical protein [Nocardioides sp.]
MAANRRKVLVPLATLMVAGTVAVGSGASFTSTTASTTSVTSGAVTHVNDKTSLAITNIKDRDVVTGSVTITNTGSLPSTLTIAETGVTATNPFIPGDLKLKLTKTVAGVTSPVFDGNFGDMVDGATYQLGSLAADPDGAGSALGGQITVNFEVTLVETTNNTNEGKDALAGFQWVSTQTAGENRGFIGTLNNAVGFGSGN